MAPSVVSHNGATALPKTQSFPPGMSNAVQPIAASPREAQPLERPGRLFFNSFSCERSPAGKCTARVILEFAGKQWTGRAEGQSSPIGDLRLGAEAAMQAVEDFAD